MMKITITIQPDGTIVGDMMNGPGGNLCVKEIDKLLAGVGNQLSETKKKDSKQNSIEVTNERV